MCASLLLRSETIPKPCKRLPKPRHLSLKRLRSKIQRPIYHGTAWNYLLQHEKEFDFFVTTCITNMMFTTKQWPWFEQTQSQYGFFLAYQTDNTNGGRKLLFTPAGMLGLRFFYLQTGSTLQNMCLIFTLALSSLSVWLNYLLDVLLQTVINRNRLPFTVFCLSEKQMKHTLLLLI